MKWHYEIERILELLIMTASDIVRQQLAQRGEPARSSYRGAFLRAGEVGIISPELSRNLSLSAGLRNILVQEYDVIDDRVLHQAIPSARRDFSLFVTELSR
jgi:uncharacterized protein YutE (UPF0331/DUF86 family)